MEPNVRVLHRSVALLDYNLISPRIRNQQDKNQQQHAHCLIWYLLQRVELVCVCVCVCVWSVNLVALFRL